MCLDHVVRRNCFSHNIMYVGFFFVFHFFPLLENKPFVLYLQTITMHCFIFVHHLSISHSATTFRSTSYCIVITFCQNNLQSWDYCSEHHLRNSILLFTILLIWLGFLTLLALDATYCHMGQLLTFCYWLNTYRPISVDIYFFMPLHMLVLKHPALAMLIVMGFLRELTHLAH